MATHKRLTRTHAQIRLIRKRIQRIDRFFIRALHRLSTAYYAYACAMLLAYGMVLFMLTPMSLTFWYTVGALLGASSILIATAWSMQMQLAKLYHRWGVATSAPVVTHRKRQLFTPVRLDQGRTARTRAK